MSGIFGNDGTRSCLRVTAAVLLLALAAAWAIPARAQSAEEVQRIENAMPDKARVAPQKPRKLLVFNLCKGYKHSAIPYGAKALEIMGRKTGAFEAVLTDDPAVFTADSLKQFDAVCFNNTTGELFDDAAMKQALLDFAKSGKGIVGIHAATDCFYEWAEYGEMMGGYFDGHPWGAGDTVSVKIDDPAHPLTRAFMGRGFDVKDEIYQLRTPYSRENLRVLLTLGPGKTDFTKKGIKRTDGDFAVSWIRTYGKGRVFYNSLGHNHEIFWTPSILQYYLDGIQYALGDLPADATPSAKLPADYLEKSTAKMQAELLDQLAAAIAKYEFGQSRRDVTVLEDMIVASKDNPEGRARIAQKLAGLIGGPATYAGKQFACTMLYRIGTDREVPALSRLLANPETADMARYALQGIRTGAADDALLAALRRTKGATRVGVINSLGVRRCNLAVPALAPLAQSKDRDTAQAAIAALGAIATPWAAHVLDDAYAAAPEDARPVVANAWLQCADMYVNNRQPEMAEEIYRKVYDTCSAGRIRGAALVGLVKCVAPADAAALVVAALGSDDACLRDAAGVAARSVTGPEATKVLVAAVPKLSKHGQALLVGALGARGDASALPAAIAAAGSDDLSVRCAGIAALAQVGDASAAGVLARAAAQGDRQQQQLARNSLARLRGNGVTEAILDALKTADAPVRAELVWALGERGASEAAPDLIALGADEDGDVRAQVYRSLAMLVSGADLPETIALLVQEPGAITRREAEKAVVAAARKASEEAEPEKKASEATVPALAVAKAAKKTGDPGARASLVNVLGELADDTTLPVIEKMARKRNDEVSEAGIRALSGWPNGAPADALAKLAKKKSGEKAGVLALRGMLDVLRLKSNRSMDDTLDLYGLALELAPGADEKRQALSGLGELDDGRALDLIEPCLTDDEVKEEAKQAYDKVKAASVRPAASDNTRAAANALDGKPETRWDTGKPQVPGQWFRVGLGQEAEITKIVLDSAGSPNDYPRGYEVYVSSSKDEWGDAVAKGAGTQAVTEIAIPSVRGRYIKVVQTGKADSNYWSIHEFRVESK